VRVALLVLLLLVAVAARAEDDDGTAHQPALGPGIPERLEQLEKEWADDVGKDASDDSKADADDDAAEPADADHDDDDHQATAKPKMPEVVIPKASKPGPLTRPARDDGGDKHDAAKSTAAPADGSSPAKPAAPAPAPSAAPATAED
jgi:hypothetical protein